MYYLRTRAAADAVKFTVDARVLRERSNTVAAAAAAQKAEPAAAAQAAAAAVLACSLQNREDCLMCGS